MHPKMIFQLPMTWVFLFVFVRVIVATESFPLIDLGYARHTPTKVNQTSLHNISYATYANIRFAQSPIGNLRFRLPQAPNQTEQDVQDGIVPRNSTNCLQSMPYYFDVGGLGINGTTWGSEDCLFLDVIVPQGIKQGDKLPVLHWIYGGGFFFGAKDNGGNPAALFDDMMPDQKFIIVTSNYRLGTLGWMSSIDEKDIAINIGLYDGLAALQWTRDYIDRFGGDANQITVMGQSAGGGIIEHMVAANFKGKPVPFQQAILSSPGYRPHVNRSEEMTQMYRSFLKLTGCEDIKCLREVNSSVITEANRYLFQDAAAEENGFPSPSIGYAPILDDNIADDLPERIMATGNTVAQNVSIKRIMVGGMRNEMPGDTYPSWKDQLSIFARTPSLSSTIQIQNLYGKFDGSIPGYSDNGTVTVTPYGEFVSDIIFTCHSQIAAAAWSRERSPNTSSYRYEMSIPPAMHGQDLYYYFYNKEIAAVLPASAAHIAKTFQGYIRSFILGKELDGWPEYSSSGLEAPMWVNITAGGFEVVMGKDEVDVKNKCTKIVELFAVEEDRW